MHNGTAFQATPLSSFVNKRHGTHLKQKRPKRALVSCHPMLKRAFAEKRLDDIGQTVRLDSNRTICSPLLDKSSVSPIWNDAVNFTVELLRAQLGESLHSLYLRGSVAAGHAYEDGRSDLDFVALSAARISPPRLRRFPFVRRVDVSYFDPDILPPHVRFTLLAYCIHLYGVDIRRKFGCVGPSPDTLMNIRADFHRAQDHQWFLKRALRSLVDALGSRIHQHARDIVPCVRILSQVRPQYAELAARAAVAIASAVSDDGLSRDIVDWSDMEYAAIRCGTQTLKFRMAPPALVPDMTQLLRAGVADNLFAVGEIYKTFLKFVSSNVLDATMKSKPPFIRDQHPTIALPNLRQVREVPDIPLKTLFYYKTIPNEPVIYRGALDQNTTYLRNCSQLIWDLSNTFYAADIRISRGPEFCFCRSNHGWVDFMAPSSLVRMSPHKFLEFARDNSVRVYMQTEVKPRERLFPITSGAAQQERRWICTQGAVSTLHYDAAHSALAVLTGAKRMIFLPPHALPRMGVYPDGHPLARRAMVDLTRPNATLFTDFWRYDASAALEAWVRPGDVVFFPSFWSHYTESHADEGELCVAHTVRWVT